MEVGRTHPKKKENKNTWRRGLHTELKTIGKTWNDVKKQQQQQKTERSGKKL